MRQSQLFTRTQKTFPKDEESFNARLLIKGGFIRKMSAGIYAFLPLGWRVLQKINQIIREEMNTINGQELLMPTLVAKEYWEKSGRWNTEAMFKINQLFEAGLGWTHEEVIAYLATHFIHSYQDLPLAVYQIQNKFRAEARAKSGLLRGREFFMKDLYSFHADKEDLDSYYQEVIKAYVKILKRLSLQAKLTEASGGAFTKEFTHEFQVLSPAGEDEIFYCPQCNFSQNKEIFNISKYQNFKCPKCNSKIQRSAAIEVANIFKLGTRYSEAFNLYFVDKTGHKKLVVMGSYGIGPSRLMGTLVEVFNDKAGIIWPESVSPYKVHLLVISGKNKKVEKFTDKIYTQFTKAGIDVLYDDRDVSAGEKLADADLLGISWRAIVSEKTLPAGRQAAAKIEIKRRGKNKTKLINLNEFIKLPGLFR